MRGGRCDGGNGKWFVWSSSITEDSRQKVRFLVTFLLFNIIIFCKKKLDPKTKQKNKKKKTYVEECNTEIFLSKHRRNQIS